MSTPDSVLPSLRNCTASVVGLAGPSDSSNLALRDPAPETLVLLRVPGMRERNERLLLTPDGNVPRTLPEVQRAPRFPHQTELGSDCMLVTSPSTGTRIWTLDSGPGAAMDSGL
ncbi:hypothetical protein EYF80_028562 [Liparis tanakae]|uniref:Uncharacterized protein n=1 Tax=Liparis tanakae TaxID=230148 RepID=A0A4Z2H5W2_9TELE|nr:hypothetical protein EYF80_028562 [Liparis tanakae]